MPPANTTGRTQYYAASSLDGFIAGPNHSLDWLFQFGEDETADYDEFIAGVGAIAMGSSTYEWILNHQILPGADHPRPWPYTQPVWVFTTRSLPTVKGADIRFVHGDVAPVHAEMMEAADGRNVWIMGGGDLAGQFYDRGLLDDIIVTIAPVTLERGAPLFPRTIVTPPMRLVSVRSFGSVYAQLRYELPPLSRIDEYRVIVERYLSAYNRLDVPGMIAELHPGVVFRNITEGTVTVETHGIAAFKDLAEGSKKMFRARQQTIHRYTRHGDEVTAEVDFEGVLAVDLEPELRAGETIRLHGRSTYRFQDGLIAEIVDES